MIRASLAQTRQFILEKNYLASQSTLNVWQLAAELAGLPADLPSTPVLAAEPRVKAFRPDDVRQAVADRHLIKAVLMRNVPYLIAVEQYPRWHAATARQRQQALNADFRLWGVETNAEIEALAETIMAGWPDSPQAETAESVAGGLPRGRLKQLTQTSRGGRVSQTSNVTLALRWLESQGVLCLVDSAADWRTEARAYARLDQRYSDLDLAQAPAEAEAQQALVRAYLAACGPATEADISFWTGLGKSETARATNALSSETELTMVEGLPGMLLTLKSQTELLASTESPAQPVITVLPANDPYPIAHRASRSRYLSDQRLQRQVFSSSGAAHPTILVDGQVVGVWHWQSEAGLTKLTWRMLTEVEPPLLTLIEAEIERVGTLFQPEIWIVRDRDPV